MNLLHAIVIATPILLIGQKSYSQCANTSNIYTFTYSGKTYEVIKEKKTWTNAVACAIERGGILTEINNQAEQTAIFSQVNSAGININNTTAPDGGGGAYVWIGGNDLTTEGNWVWNGNNDGTSTQFWSGTATGSPVGGLYNNWGDEPDDYMGQQDALGLSLDGWPQGVTGEWNDLNATNALYFVVEFPASSLGLNEEQITNELTVYPNPSTHSIQLKGSEIGAVYRIFNSTGTFVQENSIQTDCSIDISKLDQGVYFIQTTTSRPVMFLKK